MTTEETLTMTTATATATTTSTTTTATTATATATTTTTATATTTTTTTTTMRHETSISNVETEYLEINLKGAWPLLYQHIRNECSNYGYTTNESKKPQNKNLNRYRDVAPYDHTRIILKRGSCDYINANLIKVDRAKRQYILTQGPLPNTAGHFWLMVWEQNSRAVLMLNKVIEKNQIKCHQYFPLSETDPIMMFPDVGIKVIYVSKVDHTDYITRTLRLVDLESLESREVLHFHYTTWPDFGVPQSPTAFLSFLVDVRQSGALDENVGPPVVHCSAGIGRSGTFCLVDTCLVLIEQNGLNSVNVRDVLLEMRRSRMGLIQTPDQLRFSYAAIIDGAKQLPSTETVIDSNRVTGANHCGVVNNIVNRSIQEEAEGEEEEDEEEEEEEESPPLPPPRGESLTRSMMSELTPTSSAEDNETNNPPDKPLPMEPSAGSEPSADSTASNAIIRSNNSHDNYNDSTISKGNSSSDADRSSRPDSTPSSPEEKSEVRHRYRERNERLAAQVREMKRRQQESEEWKKLKRSLFKPLTIGIGAAIVGGGVIALCGYFYMRG